MFLGIEIGGTKLQFGVGRGDGPPLETLERLDVEPQYGAEGIRKQIVQVSKPLIERYGVRGIGIGLARAKSTGPPALRLATTPSARAVVETSEVARAAARAICIFMTPSLPSRSAKAVAEGPAGEMSRGDRTPVEHVSEQTQ